MLAAIQAIAVPTMSTLTHERLLDHLRLSVNILRGAVEPFDFATCRVILGLLVLKHHSDCVEANLHEPPTLADALDTSRSSRGMLRVPEEARWAKIAGLSDNLIRGLNDAIGALCRENPSLAEYLVGINFASISHILGSAQQTDRILREVIVHLSTLDLADANLPEPDMLGRAFDEFLEKFAEVAEKKSLGVSVPVSISRLLVELLDPEEGHLLCDPVCRLGSNLIVSSQYVAAKSGKKVGIDDIALTLHGQEKSPDAWAICKLSLLLHKISNARIENGDVIVEPKFVEDGRLIRYDRIFMVPPFGYKLWDRSVLEMDVYGRFHGRQSVRGELAFVQHAVASLAANGSAGIVVPHGVLFRGASDVAIRQELLKEEDCFEAVIGLPSSLFFGTSLSVVILLLNRNKTRARRGKVLFVDASKDYEPRPGKNILRSRDIARIVDVCRSWRDENHYSRVVSASEIEENSFDMSIGRYVPNLEYQETTDVIADLLASLAEAERVRDVAAVRMDALLANLGHEYPS